MTKRHYAAALSLANKARKKLGLKPVKRLKKGVPGEPSSCAIANTIDPKGKHGVLVDRGVDTATGNHTAGVYLSEEDFGDSKNSIVNGGKLAAEFIRDFDAGKYPELVEED